jgi:DNA-directed RNA polymerase specialized sigma24 family protein
MMPDTLLCDQVLILWNAILLRDNWATLLLWNALEQPVKKIIRAILLDPARTLEGSDGVANQVYSKLLAQARAGKVWESGNHLLAFVRQVAIQEARLANRYAMRQKRHSAERSISINPGQAQAVSHESTPEEVAVAEDELTWLLANIPESSRQIVAKRLEGFRVADIAHDLGLDERTIRKKLAAVRRLVQERRATNAGA